MFDNFIAIDIDLHMHACKGQVHLSRLTKLASILYSTMYATVHSTAEMNYSNCWQEPVRVPNNVSDADYTSTVLVMSTAVGVSVVVCLITMVIILALKLHKKLVYRMTIYWILSIILVLLIWEVFWAMKFKVSNIGKLYALETMTIFCLWMYEFISTWFVLHLFALAMCHKNLKKLEPLYVGSSVLIPTVLAAVSFALLFIKGIPHCSAFHVLGTIQGIVACVLIVLNFVSVIIIGAVLCHRAYRRRNGLSEQQHKKALCEMLPLLLYPVLAVVVTPALVIVQQRFDNVVDSSPRFIIPIIMLGWSAVFSFSVLSHLVVVIYVKRQNTARINSLSSMNKTPEEGTTVNESSNILVRSDTYCSIPQEV